MDERGSGIRRMIRVLEQHGNPTPFFKADHDCLVVEFAVPDRDTAFNPSGLDSPQKEEGRKELPPRDAILRELTKAEHITTAQCVQRLGIPRTTAYRILSVLHKEETLEQSGTGRGTKYALVKSATAKRK